MKLLAEANEFTADITVPEGADPRTAAGVEAPIQRLTNRSRYLLNQLAAAQAELTHMRRWISCDISGGGAIPNGTLVPLVAMRSSGGVAVSGNLISVPANGFYEISAHVEWRPSDASTVNLACQAVLALSSSGGQSATLRAVRATGSGSAHVTASVSLIVQVTAFATQRISLASDTSGTCTYDGYVSVRGLPNS